MEDASAFTYKEEKPPSSFICNLIFSHFGLFVLVTCYSIFGAYSFIYLERDNELMMKQQKVMASLELNDTINYMAQLLWYYSSLSNYTLDANYTPALNQALNDLDNQIMAIEEYDGTVYGWTDRWTFSEGLMLTVSTITTIGYGRTTPATAFGQMFLIIYALVGCPLLLLFLANFGEAMGKVMIYIYSRLCCRFCRAARKTSELPPGASKRDLKLLIDDDVGKEEYMPTSEMFVPITLNIVILLVLITAGAYIFAAWEGWLYYNSSYFTFITISTIGYGDYCPELSLVNNVFEDLGKTLQMTIVFLYILFGMAILSMVINLMQTQVMEKCRYVAEQIGLSANKDPNAPPAAPSITVDGVEKPGNPSKRKDSVAATSVPDSPGRTPSRASTRPASALSLLPGAMEQ